MEVSFSEYVQNYAIKSMKVSCWVQFVTRWEGNVNIYNKSQSSIIFNIFVLVSMKHLIL